MGLAKLLLGVLVACSYGASAADVSPVAVQALALAVVLGAAALGARLRRTVQESWRSKSIQEQ